MLMWKCAFKEALKAQMIETLRPKIQKMMGPKLDKSADAVLEAMSVKFQAMSSISEAKHSLKEKFQSIMAEGK